MSKYASRERRDHFFSHGTHHAAHGTWERSVDAYFGRRWERDVWNFSCTCGYEWQSYRLPGGDSVYCPRCGFEHNIPD